MIIAFFAFASFISGSRGVTGRGRIGGVQFRDACAGFIGGNDGFLEQGFECLGIRDVARDFGTGLAAMFVRLGKRK